MYGQIIEQLIDVLDAYENKKPILSNQGQALDGYSALANFVSLAKKARDRRNDITDKDDDKRENKYPVVLELNIGDKRFVVDAINRKYLCIEQDGNKVWLSKDEIEYLQNLSEQWRIK